MSITLFDSIHDNTLFDERTNPATIEEFVQFGLQPEDFVRYVGLVLRVQSELLTEKLLKCDETYSYPTWNELLHFCKEKKLCEPIAGNNHFFDIDAEYSYDWLRYPKEPERFRLEVERSLSFFWDKEDYFRTEMFWAVYFEYDNYSVAADGTQIAEFDSPIRVKKYDPKTNEFVFLPGDEVRKMCAAVQKKLKEVERELSEHLAQMPGEHDAAAVTAGLPWIKELCRLYDKQNAAEDLLDTLTKAAEAPDIYPFESTDTLVVYCGADSCRENGHLVRDIRVDFGFYGKPNKQFTIERCAHCMQYRISSDDLLEMLNTYGVPLGMIKYENDAGGEFGNFSDTSVLYDMGYTVNQSDGLSAAKRQSILKHAIDSGKLSKNEVLQFLYQRICINGMKAGNEIARKKWSEDYEYIKGL